MHIIVGVGINLAGKCNQLESIQSIMNVKVDRMQFIDDLIGMLVLDEGVAGVCYNMPRYVWYGGERMMVKGVDSVCVVLGDDRGNVYRLNACEYGYDLKSNSINKK